MSVKSSRKCTLTFHLQRDTEPRVGIFEQESGRIASARPYGNDQHALWKIVAPFGGKLWFRFRRLEIEMDRMNGRCAKDSLRIYEEDGNRKKEALYATPPICGYLGNSTYAKVNTFDNTCTTKYCFPQFKDRI